MKFKIYIDGQSGTTGLRINERISSRSDVELLVIPEEKRKDAAERSKYIAMSDVTYLCLPDDAAREAVKLAEETGANTVIIDTSTAHRTSPDWSYGFAELSAAHREKIKASNRIAVPGCHAGGICSLVYPLRAAELMPAGYPLFCVSLTGYSGGGKKMIAEYEADAPAPELASPRQYGLSQKHKHLPEVTAVCSLDAPPHFSPIVADFYSGMQVTVPIYPHLMSKKVGVERLYELYSEHYKSAKLIKVVKTDEILPGGFMQADLLKGTDSMIIAVGGTDERPIISALFDNLGKGASGAAVQCMNIRLGIEETTGLELFGGI